jgi:hypothetical protein
MLYYTIRKQTEDNMEKHGTIAKIAADVLDLETLETQNSDSLDFHDLAVWQIKKALETAYEAGRKAGGEK